MDVLPSSFLDSARDNGTGFSLWNTVKTSVKTALGPILNGPDVVVTNAIGNGVASGVAKAGEGIKAAGEGIRSTVGSVGSGVKIGVVILIVGAALFVLGPYVGLLKRA